MLKDEARGTGKGRDWFGIEVDRLLNKRANRMKLRKVLQEEFVRNPTGFFRTIIMPLISNKAPKSIPARRQSWASLTSLMSDSEQSTPPESTGSEP